MCWMGPCILLTVWVWDMAREISEWGSLCFKTLLHPDDGGCVACQLLKNHKNAQKNTTELHECRHMNAQS